MALLTCMEKKCRGRYRHCRGQLCLHLPGQQGEHTQYNRLLQLSQANLLRASPFQRIVGTGFVFQGKDSGRPPLWNGISRRIVFGSNEADSRPLPTLTPDCDRLTLPTRLLFFTSLLACTAEKKGVIRLKAKPVSSRCGFQLFFSQPRAPGRAATPRRIFAADSRFHPIAVAA